MKKLKIGIVGIGRIGKIHIKNISENINDAIIYAAAKANVKNLPYLNKFGVKKIYNNFEELVKDPLIDAVIISSPTNFHSEHIKLASKYKKHIFCEKPIDLSMNKVKEVLDLVSKSGIKFMVGFNRRFDPNFNKVKKFSVAKKIGTTQIIKITSRDPNPPPIEYIKGSGGMFLDMAIHDFDMARYIVGSEVYSVFSSGKVFGDKKIEEQGDIDTAITILTFQNGSMATIDNSRKANYGYDQRIEVFGSKGMNGINNKVIDEHFYADSNGFHSSIGLDFFMDRYEKSYLIELKHFIDCLTNDHEPLVTGKDGIMALAIALAAKKSLEKGRVVLVSEILNN